jgi:hypothetical protein
MSQARYSRVPTEPPATPSGANEYEGESDDESSQFVEETGRNTAPPLDPRFNPPTPSAWKRAALLLFIVFLFWLSVRMRMGAPLPAEDVEHTDRWVLFSFYPQFWC